MLRKCILIFIPLLILAVNVFRFINLENIPYGVQIDEQTSGVTLACLAQEGTSPLGNTHYPLFGYNSFGTPTTPTYMYPGLLWVKAFGFSMGSLRAFTAFSLIIALWGLFAIGKTIGGTRCGLWIMAAASISPWTWTLSRIAWESTFMLPFLIWGLFFCLIGKKYWHFMAAGFLMCAAAYSYPPARLQIPFTLATLTIYGWLVLRWKPSQIITLGLAFLITGIPLIIMYLNTTSMAARFNELSITNPAFLARIGKTASPFDLLTIICQNFLTFLTPDFLFFKGTPLNMTLTTGRQGIMSWLDVTAVLVLFPAIFLNRKNRPLPVPAMLFAGLLIINLLIGILPATLISIDNPHPLRTVGSWPFAMLATGIIIHKLTERFAWTTIPAILIPTAFACVFLTQYFKQYPKESAGMFSVWTLTEARKAKTENEWMDFLYRYHPHMFTSRYFLMRYHGDSCAAARTTWEKLYPMFKNMAAQQHNKR
ncbi:MAG: hypothetical protein V2A70_00360 [Candidatus Omnitrophota bacterium]